MNDKNASIQDVFLNQCRNDKLAVTVFLVNGVKLQGVITGLDQSAVLLRREDHAQLVYKHAISTVMPSQPMPYFSGAEVA